MRFPKTVSAWMVLALIPGSAAGQSPVSGAAPATVESSSQPASEDQTQLLKQNSSSRLTLDVKINGKGPFAFIVDTGSDRTSISRELAAALALPQGPPLVVHGSAGADTTPTALIDRLTLGDRTIERVFAPAFSMENLGASGMVGVDALRDLHLVIDFQRMRLTSSESRRETLDDRTVVVRGRNLYGRLILSHSTVRGIPVLVVVDTGSQMSIGNAAMLRLLLSYGRSEPETARILSVTGREVDVRITHVPELELGGITLHDMLLGFGDLETFEHFGLVRRPALLLGMDVLSRFRKVSVDVRRREATFSLN